MDQRAHRRILLVDDTAVGREIVEAVLARAGFAVDCAADGAAACEMTWSRRYDLVLMDLQMPGMSGYEAAARIRAREGMMSGVRIAAFTAARDTDAEQLSLWSGIDAFIAKPILPTLLVARIETILAQPIADDEDWRPVWRLHAFDSWTRKLEASDIAACLAEMLDLLDEAAAAIHVHATDTERFRRIAFMLHDLAGRYGFDEVAGLCAGYREAHETVRSRDPNLLGAVGRARFAIEVWQRDHAPAAPADRRAPGLIRSLFGSARVA